MSSPVTTTPGAPVTAPNSPQHLRTVVYTPGQYAKIILHILVAVAAGVATLGSSTVTRTELVQLAILLVGSIGTYLFPYLTPTEVKYGKAVSAFLTAALTGLIPYFVPGLHLGLHEWALVFVAAANAAGVTAIPNTGAITYSARGVAPAGTGVSASS